MGINLPQMGSVARTTTGVTSFAGLDRLLKCQEYEFAAMTNMESKQLPVMSTRPPRRKVRKRSAFCMRSKVRFRQNAAAAFSAALRNTSALRP